MELPPPGMSGHSNIPSLIVRTSERVPGLFYFSIVFKTESIRNLSNFSIFSGQKPCTRTRAMDFKMGVLFSSEAFAEVS